MPVCSCCGRDLRRKDFSRSQLKKAPECRQCLGCANHRAIISYGANRETPQEPESSYQIEQRREREQMLNERPVLRFSTGDRVECKIADLVGEWRHGTIIKEWYRDILTTDTYYPYLIQLDDGQKLYTTEDEDDCIRASNKPAPSCWICFDDEQSSENPIVRDCGCKGVDSGFIHINCLTKLALTKVEDIIDSDDDWEANPFINCLTCRQLFESGSPSAIALAKKCHERFEHDDDENPFWYSFSITNLAEAMVHEETYKEAMNLLYKRSHEILNEMDFYNKEEEFDVVDELDDERCNNLLAYLKILIISKVPTSRCIRILDCVQSLNESIENEGMTCYSCRKSDILRCFCYLAWENGDFKKALKYAKLALAPVEDGCGGRSSNCLYECGCLLVIEGKKDEGARMIQSAIDNSTRLYGGNSIAVFSRKDRLQRIQNGETVTENIVALCPFMNNYG